MAKYDPLEMYLLCLSGSQNEITLSFGQVENIIEDLLPPSAYAHRAWWSNDKAGQHVNARAWLDIGWKVDQVNQTEHWVRFTRQRIHSH